MNININGYLNRYRHMRRRAFDARNELEWTHKAALSLVFALLTALAAQTRVYLGFTPVPITLQVFAVLLAGVVLGKWWGGISQGMYVTMGVAGLPVFTGMGCGIETLMGITGGYILGFVIAALVIGHVVDEYPRTRETLPMMGLMLLGVGIIYALGTIQLALILSLTPVQAIMLGVVPFVVFDVAKAIGAAFLARTILPKVGQA